MKKTLLISKIVAILIVIYSYPAMAAEEQPAVEEISLDDRISYFFGYSFAQRMLDSGTSKVNFQKFQSGFEDGLARRNPAMTQAEQKEIIDELQSRQQQQQELVAQRGLDQARQYLVENAKKDGVQVTASGLQYQVLNEGQGQQPVATNRVKVHYRGQLVNGQVFDSSIERGEPAEFMLNQVIPGWTEGLQLMKVGAKYRLTIPPELGYGPGGQRQIPPNSVLIFEVDLLEIL